MWARRFLSVAGNAARSMIGDPFFLVLHLAALALLAVLAVIPGFTYGEHVRLLRDQSQALLFMLGCLNVLFGLTMVVTGDLRHGAGSIIRSRPVGAACILAGKWAGVAAGTVLLQASGLTAYLWLSEASRHALQLDIFSLGMFFAVIVIALLAGALRHYLFGGRYGVGANLILTVGLMIGLALRLVIGDAAAVDWAGSHGGALLAFGVLAFAAVMLPVALLADATAVFGIGVLVFFAGLISDRVTQVLIGADWLRSLVQGVLPNWQLYWVADQIQHGGRVPSGYLLACAVNSLLLLILYGAIATLVYERLEIGKHSA